uniref:Protein cup n=1 Tax=Ceratitis capitata TaxID=7213 RepID=W8BT62_CERCA
MNTSGALPIDVTVDGRRHSHQVEGSTISEKPNSTAYNCDDIKRYSRLNLFDLRNGLQSRRRPESGIRAGLQSLGIWKFNNGGNAHQNSVNTSREGNGISNSTCGASHSMQMSTHSSVRSQRSPSRRDLNAVSVSNSSLQHNLPHHNLNKNFIDHRSISSSHLMPAFAKRRLAASTNNVTGVGFQNLPGSGNLCYDSNSRSQTPTDIKDVLNLNGISIASNGHVRQRTQGQLYDYPHRGNSSDVHNTYLSPQKKKHEYDRDRDMELQSNNGRLSSPVTLGSSRQSGVSNERRIGSGRLLPRDVNWDFHTTQDRDKTQNMSNVSTAEKEIVGSNSLIQFRSGVRYSDRQYDRIAGGNEYIDRRHLERRSGDENFREKYEYMDNTHSPSFHGSSTKRDFYGADASLSQHTNHNRNRRNHHYNDRNEEPEWFSSGPTSQHDTIELRGFEEIDDHYKSNAIAVNGPVKRANFASSRKVSENSSSLADSILNLSKSKSREELQESLEQERERIHCANKSPTNLLCIKNESEDVANEEEKNKLNGTGDNNGNTNCLKLTRNKSTIDSTLEDFLEKEGTSENRNNTKINAREIEFNFDVFLNPNLDPLTHTLMLGNNSVCEAIGTSRFSRWFGNKVVVNDTQISTGSNNVGNNTTLLPGFGESENETNTLMEFLNKLPHLQDSGISQKAITSVGELEARMREVNVVNEISSGTEKVCLDIKRKEDEERALELILPINNDQLTTGQPKAGEVEAFKKLLEQLGSENKQIQQQHKQLQQHVPPNMQMNVLVSEQNRSAPIPPLNIVHPVTILPSTPRPQQLLLKNEELNKIINPQVLRQQLTNNTDVASISHSQPIQLPMFGNHSEKRLETQNLYQHIQRGEISIRFLEQELSNPNTSLQAKEAIASVLSDYSNISHNQQNSKSGPTGHQQQHSPIPICNSSGKANQNPSPTNPSSEQLLQQPLTHISNANVMIQGQSDRALLLPTHQSSNHQVIPSQRDSQFHTHTTMQNAMMQRKIEEQQLQPDSHKRRQEIQKQSQSNHILLGHSESDIQQKSILLSNNMQQPSQQHISHTIHQQQRHINSPTPLAFTPTSVLRKMTAEKDNVVIQQQNKAVTQNAYTNFQTNQQNTQQPITTQPRMILGGNHSQQLQQMSSSNQSLTQAPQQHPMQAMRNSIGPMKWPIHLVTQNMPSTKPMGRPILKGTFPPQTSSQQNPPQQQMSQISQMMFNKLDFQQIQQQQRMKATQSSQHVLNQPTSPFHQHSQQASGHTTIISQVHQQQLYQQQRVLALQRHQQQQYHLQQQLQHQQHPSIDALNRNSKLSTLQF